MIFLEYFKASQGPLRSRPVSIFYAPIARICDQAICIKCTYIRPQKKGKECAGDEQKSEAEGR